MDSIGAYEAKTNWLSAGKARSSGGLIRLERSRSPQDVGAVLAALVQWVSIQGAPER